MLKGKRILDLVLFLFCAVIALLAYFYLTDTVRWVMTVGGGFLALLFLISACGSGPKEEIDRRPIAPNAPAPVSKVSELVMLNEDGKGIAVWPLYGKTSMVIGRDVGENSVDVNLSAASYASMVAVEHAVLNYSGTDWYVEDLASKNGVSVQKKVDGKKYKLAPDKPCRLEQGDMVFIAMTRLLLR